MSAQEQAIGRPTRSRQLSMEKKLRPFFDKGITASLTSSKTGINIKTVCKYFNTWSHEIQELEHKELSLRIKRERDSIIALLDNQLLDGYQLHDEMNKQIEKLKKENSPVPKHLYSFKLETMKFISNIVEKKIRIMSQASEKLDPHYIDVVDINITEEQIRDITRFCILVDYENNRTQMYDEDELIECIVWRMNYDMTRARIVLQKMKDAGLTLYWQNFKYDVRRFAQLKCYVTDREFEKVDARIKQLEKEERKTTKEYEMKMKEREMKFVAKYGERSSWTREIREEFYSEDDDLI